MHLKVLYKDRPDDITVVRVEGDVQGVVLDATCAPPLRSTLLEVNRSGRLILVIDLSAVDGIDKAVLHVLIGVRDRARVQGGTLALVVTSQQVRKSLADAGPGDAIPAYENMASAVAEVAADYAERSVEQRRAAIMEAGGIVPQGGHAYEHVSEYITVVTLVGELSTYDAPPLRQLLVDLINHGRIFLVLDMTEVFAIDSTGQGVLAGALKRVRAQDGGIALVMPYGGSLTHVFRITGLTKVFPIFDTVDRAVEFLGRELGAHG